MIEKQPILSFISSYPNKNTRSSYQSTLVKFAKQIVSTRKGTSTKVTDEELKSFDEEMLVYLTNGKSQEDYFKDILKFAFWLQSKPPKTADANVSIVKEFFLTNGIEFTRQQQKEIRRTMPKGGALTIENELDVDTFKSILEHCDITGRALFITLKGSGMRVDECLQIKLNDLDLK